ncbi:unnamed protein product [Larinioides sclopetarius]|uniref:Uncharacterized protein n=1 Tax=Larinioides sclopetarius TaxID=280406 RepID=A0AAV1ZCS3_9ARAC
MDEGDSRRIDGEQVNLPNGHWIKDITFGHVPYSTETIYFERTFDFNCVMTPSSWLFRVTFTRIACSDVSCESVIKRTDDGPGLMNVQFWTTIRIDPVCFDVSYVQHFISGMSSHQVDRQVFSNVISSEYAEILGKKKIYSAYASIFCKENIRIQFLLSVHDCHIAQDMAESCMGRDGNR